MDCNLPGSPVHGILQARVLKWGAIAFSHLMDRLYLFIFNVYFFLSFWLCQAACGTFVPQPGIEPMPPAFERQSLNNWTTREVLNFFFILAVQYLLGVAIIQSHIFKYHLCADTPKYYFQS